MKIKNLGEPFDHSIRLRLTKSEYDYINELAFKYDKLPSQVLRMMIDSFVPGSSMSTCDHCIYRNERVKL